VIYTGNIFSADTDILVIEDGSSLSSGLIMEDVISAGYSVTSILPEHITYEIIAAHRLTIVSTGSNPNALINNFMRYQIQRYVDEGWKIIVEGGQTAYIALINPVYPAFQNKVLKIMQWTAHDAGDLIISPEYTGSELATVPNILSHSIKFDFKEDTDMDVCSNNSFSEIFYTSSFHPGKAGIIIYPSIDNLQIINYCFSYAKAENRSDIKNLLVNSIYNLIGSPVSVSQINSEIPSGFLLEQNFPNPFNSSTVIKFSLPEPTFAEVSIFDITGKEVNNTFKDFLNPGTYQIKLNLNDLSSGVYIYKLQTEKFTSVKSMILIK